MSTFGHSKSIGKSRKMSTARRAVSLCIYAAIGGIIASYCDSTMAKGIIQVGPLHKVKSLAAAAALAEDGDTVEVESGEYSGDVAVWDKDNITVRAVHGRVRLIADGMSAEGKGIWVMRGGQMTVEGLDFTGAQVNDKNGAGIRLEKGKLTVRDCSFTQNQNGILTNNNPLTELEIIDSEFGHNGHGDGQSHNLYVGSIARLTVRGSYFHHAKVGHLLKSRAAINDIRYNRLTDEAGGSASYELEITNGGVAYIIGNIIQQGSQTENPNIISYAAEGYKWPKNELYLINNTLVDSRPRGGVFLRMKPGEVTVKAVNNLLVGTGNLQSAGPGEFRNNTNVDWNEFELAAREDFRLKRSSKLRGTAVDPGQANGLPLAPDSEYRHPRQTVRLTQRASHPGALQSGK